MMKVFMSLILLISLSTNITAQGNCHYTLKGTVKKADTKKIVPYAAIVIKELGVGTETDENGNFSISNLCRQTYTLEISHIDCNPHTESLAIEGDTEGVFLLQHVEKVLSDIVIKDKRVALEVVQAKSVLDNRDLDLTKGQLLADALKALPGVSTLNTGSNISKPVIQGLHSDRILIYNNGVRQEGQQWGLDHAPEIDPHIANTITVIKGASGIKYGVGAIGGVILIEPKPLRDTLGINGELHLGAFTNGRMGVVSSSIDGKSRGLAWRIQGSAKRGGNLMTPQYILANTGVEELNGSAAIGFRLKDVPFDIFYSHFYTKIGIFKESHIGNLTDLQNAIERGQPLKEAEFLYEIGRPAQRINHDIVKIKTTIPTGHGSRLGILTYFQHDLREEFDAHKPGGKIPVGFNRPEIAFQMPTIGTRLDWEHRPYHNWHGGLGIEGQYQYNNTYAGALIPDFRQNTLGLYWTERHRKYASPLEVEMGVRYDTRRLAVDSNRFGDTNRQYDFNNVSASLGGIYHWGKRGKIVLSLGTAWRSPNVNELFSNGVHHGTASFEQGDPNLKPERAYNSSIALHFDHSIFEVDANAYLNYINDFIYLRPDGAPVLTIRGAFPAFSYHQTDAILRGGDISLTAKLYKKVSLLVKGSTLYATNLLTKEWLSLMPADRIETSLKIDNQSFSYFKNVFSMLTLAAVRRQGRIPLSIADYQLPPDGYSRLDFVLGGDMLLRKQKVEMIFKIENIFNIAYKDYLDRLRYFSHAAGRNVSIRLKTYL